MPDDWRDKLAGLLGDDDFRDVTVTSSRSPGKTHRIAEAVTTAVADGHDVVTIGLDRDEIHRQQAAALDRVLTETGRTIRTPHETAADRAKRLRGIPAIGTVGGAIPGTRPGA